MADDNEKRTPSPGSSSKPGVHHGESPANPNSVVAETGATRDPADNNEAPFQFDAKAEARLCRKIDLYIVPTVALLYLFCFIDRANIGNAKIAGLEKELGLQGYDYNALLSIFYISYIVFEIPSNIMCKWIGPGWYIPAISLAFGIISLATAFVHNFSQAAGVRFLLGVFEAGMLPGIAYYMSRWYRRAELTFRLSLYIVMAPLAGAFGGLLASGILSLDHVGGVTGWRMIFVVEGIITIGLSVIGFLTLTDRPATARWLSPAEKELATARIASERITTTAVLDRMDTTKLIRGITSPVTMSTSLLFLLNNITVQGLAFFAPTIVRTIYPDKSTVMQQLYTVPPYVVGAFFTVVLPLISWKLDKRQIVIVLTAPLVIVGYSMFLGTTDASARYGATFLLTSSLFAVGPLSNAQVSANVVSDTARTSAIGLNVMLGNIGGLIATWSYLPWDEPNYHIGNGLNLAACCAVLLLSVATLVWMPWDNARRDKAGVPESSTGNPEGGQTGVAGLEGLSREEVEGLDWKHPAFRWKP
ncbi:major facilitator superfamily domain-containing protein [Dichotomopilus funicola]|uniref:Major facilitator superfamily domain-containing protein n=1 Tax=Dichotomopilus funicola TaxID=1934379 RepID=A0AAN6V6B9_9PEZI|nr:major facilitator superfamily domain-containing protein [Dichotomopilus funicola]